MMNFIDPEEERENEGGRSVMLAQLRICIGYTLIFRTLTHSLIWTMQCRVSSRASIACQSKALIG
jgi:hypothetical protein